MSYDDDNIFARILRGELPCERVFEDDHVLAFHDIHPQAPVHVLVIPKGRYRDWSAFAATAGPEEIEAYVRGIGTVVRRLKLDKGCRLLVNQGADGGQEVPHLHTHIFAGRSLGPMLRKKS